MFHRKIEEKLRNWASDAKSKPLIVNGARQVGKSTVLRKFGQENFLKMHYFNFEIEQSLRSLFESSLDPGKILRGLALEKNVSINIETDLIFFDEIQNCPQALHSLKYFNEIMPNARICAAGSLLGIHTSSSSYPVGKVDELYMYPMSFQEFLLALDYHTLAAELGNEIDEYLHAKFWDIWKLYLVTGGLPEVVSIYQQSRDDIVLALSNVREKQRLIISEYIRDMAQYSGKINALHLERVFRAIPAQLAKQMDDSVRRFKFSGVLPGVSQYSRFVSTFDWLAGSGLIFKIPVIDSVDLPLVQHVSQSRFKAYIFDVGVLSALAEIPPKMLLDFRFDTYKGFIAENFVLQELVCNSANSLYCWQGTQAEIEFVTTNLSGVIPIEVKAGAVKKAKSFASYIKRYNPEKGFVLGSTTSRKDGRVFREPIYKAGVLKI